jgi:Tfp pilus assembly protein PilF
MAAAPPMPGQLRPKQQKPPEPPEEDESLKPKEYGFNPLQATKEIKVGEYYMKKGKHTAAAKRFEEATRWDPGNAEAWLRLAEVREKMKNDVAAKEAYAKYLEVAPDAKNAAAIRKKLEKK